MARGGRSKGGGGGGRREGRRGGGDRDGGDGRGGGGRDGAAGGGPRDYSRCATGSDRGGDRAPSRGGGGGGGGGGRGRGGGGGGGGGGGKRRAFESAFPAPAPPLAPRRPPPSLHSDPLHAPLLAGLGTGGGVGGGGGGGVGGVGGGVGTGASNGVVYRTADSTQRALNELAQRRQERMERRRAGALLMCLLCLAAVVHFAGVTAGVPGGGAEDGEGTRKGLRTAGGDDAGGGEGDAAAASAADSGGGGGKKAEGGAGGGGGKGDGGEGDSGGTDGERAPDSSAAARPKTEAREAPPEEPVLPEGKEFLQPLKYFSDVKAQRRKSDTPFFFHVPRSGGQTIKEIVGKCFGKVLASEVGVRDGHGNDPTLNVIEIKSNKYVNVDTTSVDGLRRAASLGLAESKLADLVTSSYLKESGTLFDLHHQGRAFLVMRNPVQRAVSMYYHRTRGEAADLDSGLTIEEFAQGNGIENNWMTRFLVDAMEGELTKVHLNRAKEVLEKKFLIGFLDDGEETMARVMKYFGWEYSSDETEQMKQEDCMKYLLKDGTNVNPDGYDVPKKGTQAYALIMWQTQFDIKLFDYARELFDQQTKHWGTKERKKELKKKKKKGGK